MQIKERVRSWLEPSGAEEQAEAVFRSLWEETARAESTRHPFHREVLTDLDVLLANVAVAAPDTLVRLNGITIPWDALPQRYPHISRRLTTDWIRSFVVEEVARVAVVADSTDYLTARSRELRSGRIQHQLTVQHRLSGLRATFFWDDGEQIGGVFAKSYSIRSIDPDRSWTHEGSQAVDEWQGLGITSQLYQHGVTLQPDLRWGVTTLTDRSARLRRRLHQIDPWRFAAASDPEHHPQDACLWCIEHGWAQLDRTGFISHPTDE